MKSICQAITVIGLMLACCAAGAAGPLFAPEPGVVVLKNGRVLEGGVLREGDRYIVTLGPKGVHGELKIPASEVLVACRDLPEAYEFKRRQIRERAVKPHLELAEWCIGQQLFDRAADEIVTARSIDAHDSRIAAVERRLKLSVATPDEKRPLPVYSLPPTQEDIAATVRTLPDETIAHFATHVQPVLLSRCAATACHGPASRSDFHLVRPPVRHVNTTRETQRNLFAAMAQVRHEGESPLLAMALAPHGNARSPALDIQDRRQIELLNAWIEMVRTAPPPGNPAAATKFDSNVRPAAFEEPQQQRPPAPLQADPNARPLPRLPGASSAAPRREGTQDIPVSDVTRDPFDPEIFNERYGK